MCLPQPLLPRSTRPQVSQVLLPASIAWSSAAAPSSLTRSLSHKQQLHYLASTASTWESIKIVRYRHTDTDDATQHTKRAAINQASEPESHEVLTRRDAPPSSTQDSKPQRETCSTRAPSQSIPILAVSRLRACVRACLRACCLGPTDAGVEMRA